MSIGIIIIEFIVVIIISVIVYLFMQRKKSTLSSQPPTLNSSLNTGDSQPTTPNSQPSNNVQNLMAKVRRVEIKTKNLSNDLFSGSYHSAFKGRGMSFSEVRNYSYGDDVRNIDWNVTARNETPFVKVFEEERELTVILMIDISKSSFFGTSEQFKSEVITEIAAVLSFSAIQNNDKVGVLFFSDKIEKFIPPKKGKSHILRIIRELINIAPTSPGTNIQEALRHLNNMMKKRAIVFLLSDFMDEQPYEDALKLARKKHDIIGIQTYDQRETSLPDIGLMQIYDVETQQHRWIDTGSKKTRAAYQKWFEHNQLKTKNTFAKCGTEFISIETLDSYSKALLKVFKKRK